MKVVIAQQLTNWSPWKPWQRLTVLLTPKRRPAAPRYLSYFLILTSILAYPASSHSQTQNQSQITAALLTPATKDGDDNPLLTLPPRSWAVDAAANELVALNHPGSYLRYRMHTVDEKGDKVRDVIESKDGTVARLILKDGRPLTDDEDQAERRRLNAMIASPSDFAKHIKNDDTGKKVANDLIKLMPDAMLYAYTPGQPQTGRNSQDPEIVLDYKPNPKFVPPTTTSQALTGLEGRAWIDSKTHQLVRMEGTIFQSINFGWGVLAHIYPGGKVSLEMTNAGGQRWIFTHFTQQVSVRALMVKTLKVNAIIDGSDFQTLPGPISYQDAIKMLLNAPLPTR